MHSKFPKEEVAVEINLFRNIVQIDVFTFKKSLHAKIKRHHLYLF